MFIVQPVNEIGRIIVGPDSYKQLRFSSFMSIVFDGGSGFSPDSLFSAGQQGHWSAINEDQQ